jgi:hypothetical protein
VDLLAESWSERRSDLINACNLLNESAQQIDAREPRGFAPNPTATVLRGVAQLIRQHLRGPCSGNDRLPESLVEALRLTLDLIASSGDAVMPRLGSLVKAFDVDGNPAVELFAKAPGRVARLYGRATVSVGRLAALVGAATGLVLPLAVVILVFLGKLRPDESLDLLK